MKKGIIAATIFIAILVAALVIRPRIQQYTELPGQYQTALSIISQLESVLGEKDIRYNEVIRVSNERKQRVDSMLAINQEYEREINRLEQVLADIVVPDIPVLPEVTPVDMEECLNELESARNTSDLLRSNIKILQEENTGLKSLNLTQALLIKNQHAIITTQADDIAELRQAYEQDLQTQRQKKVIAYGLAVAAILINIVL